MRIDDDERALEVTLRYGAARERCACARGGGAAAIEGATRADSADAERMVAYVLRLDGDLSPFYELAAEDSTSRGRRPARAG